MKKLERAKGLHVFFTGQSLKKYYFLFLEVNRNLAFAYDLVKSISVTGSHIFYQTKSINRSSYLIIDKYFVIGHGIGGRLYPL